MIDRLLAQIIIATLADVPDGIAVAVLTVDFAVALLAGFAVARGLVTVNRWLSDRDGRAVRCTPPEVDRG